MFEKIKTNYNAPSIKITPTEKSKDYTQSLSKLFQ